MTATIHSLRVVRGVPRHNSSSRQVVKWSDLSNENLKFSLDLLSLHQSPYEVEVANEITRRIEAGIWLDMDKTPPPLAPDVPKWLKTWPFSLLWSQRPR
jgi:hypothetical protein